MLRDLTFSRVLSLVFVFQLNVAFADPAVVLDSRLSRKVSETSVKGNSVYSLGFANSTCSGAQVSKYGHVLLARHCIESVIYFGQSNAKEITTFYTERTLSELPALSSREYNQYRITTQLNFFVGLDSETVPASVFFVGPGELYPRFSSQISERLLQDSHDQLTDLGYSDGGDLAIVYIPRLAGRSCLSLAQKPVDVGEKVRTVSYPCFNQDGVDWPQVRSGEVLANTLEQAVKVGEQRFRVAKGNFLVGHGAQSCNSGGPVFNAQGEVTGVLHTNLSNQNGGISMVEHVSRLFELMNPSSRDQILFLNQECRFWDQFN
jgi:Trypsin-like peptidase domain